MAKSRSSKSSLRARKPVGKVRSRRRGAGFGTWLKRAFVGTLVLGLLGVAGFFGVLWYYGQDLPPVDALRNYQPPQTSRVLDRNDELIGEIFTERRTVVSMEEIPQHMVWAVMAAEDADFYQHEGLDYPGIVRAVVYDIIEGRAAQGASTITQQVVKLMLLTPERTVARKIRELILARQLEQELTKDEILFLYLNHINFGHGRYGVQEAAQFYFGKDATELTLAEATLIAGVPQAPARLSPRSHPEAAARRQRFVLSQLEAKRAERWPDLAASDIEEARNEVPVVIPQPQSSRVAPEVMVIARRTLRDLVSDEEYARGGYTIHTTIDSGLQASAREALRTRLEELDARHGYRGPINRRRGREPEEVSQLRVGGNYTATVRSYTEDGMLRLDVGGHNAVADIPARYNPNDLRAAQFADEGARLNVSILRLPEEGDDSEPEAQLELGPQGAAIVIDPRSRDILTMIGGYEAVAGFNRATNALRQPGSTFKPIVYSLGLRSRAFTPATLVIDAPVAYDDYRPRNNETWDHEGPIRLRQALANSVNSVAFRVMEEVTPELTVQYARELGITSELYADMPLALGASEVTVLEMANAYATFAAGGRWEETRLITAIEGPDGAEVALPARAEPRDVLTPAEAYLITSMLTSVVRTGTARSARRLGRPAAGKTGTSDYVHDAWFMGYTPDTVAGVWVGFDRVRPLGRRESGGRAALPIWIDIMRAAHEDRPRSEFAMPPGVETVAIDPATGLLPYEGMEDPLDEVFLEGTAPTEHALPPDVADANTFLMEQH